MAEPRPSRTPHGPARPRNRRRRTVRGTTVLAATGILLAGLVPVGLGALAQDDVTPAAATSAAATAGAASSGPAGAGTPTGTPDDAAIAAAAGTGAAGGAGLTGSTATTAARPGAAARTAAAPPVALVAPGGGAPCPAGTGRDLTIMKSCTFTKGGTYGNVMIMGGARVAVADRPMTLRVRSLVAMGKGSAFVAGCPRPIRSALRIVITEPDRDAVSGGMDGGMLGADRADFCLRGARVAPRFDLAARTYRAGSTSVTTQRPMGLRPGDRVLFTASTVRADTDQVVTVTRASGRSFTFRPALRHAVLGEVVRAGGKTGQMRTEVARLSGSSITVATAKGAWGHGMIMGRGAVGQVSGVDFVGLGKKFKNYCLHFHLLGASPRSFVEHFSCEGGRARALVVHGTNRMRVQDVVGYRNAGTPFLWGEDCSEQQNRFEHALAANPVPTDLGGDTGDVGDNLRSRRQGPSGHWSCARNNYFRDLHSAGIDRGWGFRFDFDTTKVRGVQAGMKLDPTTLPFGVIDGLVAHSLGEDGNGCDRQLCATGVVLFHKGTLKNANPRWDKEYPGYRFGPVALHRVNVWKANGGIWTGRSTNLTKVSVMDTNRALVLQDARVDDGLVVCSSGVGAQAGGIQIGTEAYDFKTMVTNSVFARCGKGDRGGAIGFQGAYGHDQTVFYGTGLLAKVRFVDVGRTLWHPAPEGNEARGTCEWGGMALWVRDVGTMRGDGYVGFPCARGGSYPDRSNLKLVPVSQRGSIRPVLFDGSQQHSDPFRKGAYAERLTPRTSPALIKGLAPAGR